MQNLFLFLIHYKIKISNSNINFGLSKSELAATGTACKQHSLTQAHTHAHPQVFSNFKSVSRCFVTKKISMYENSFVKN